MLPLLELRVYLGLLVGPGLTVRQRAHGIRRRALHSLSLSLARHPRLVRCARAVARARRERLPRIALLRDLALRLAAAAAAERARSRARRAHALREGDLPAALLWAMLRAAGERATVEYTREMPLVRVAVAFADVRRLPPWARLLHTAAGGLEVAVAPGGPWVSAGYLPPAVRAAMDLRRPSARRTALAS